MRYFSLFIAFYMFSTPLYSQVKVRPGIKMGVNYSTITKTNLEYKSGLYVGGFANIRIKDFYAVQPELLYSQQGGDSNRSNIPNLEIHYISLTVPNMFFVIPNNGFHFLIGPTLDFNVKNNPGNIFNDKGQWNITPIDLTYVVGIGYEFDFGFILEVRYKHGVANVDWFNRNEEYASGGNEDHYNTLFQFGAAYKFDF